MSAIGLVMLVHCRLFYTAESSSSEISENRTFLDMSQVDSSISSPNSASIDNTNKNSHAISNSGNFIGTGFVNSTTIANSGSNCGPSTQELIHPQL